MYSFCQIIAQLISCIMNRPEMSSWWRRNVNWRTLYLLLLGQVVSFLLALTNFSSSLIANSGVDAPITQGFFTYLTLAFVYGSILVYRRQKPLVSWYWYLLLVFFDVQGIFLYNKAYQFTSITSVTMLDSFSIAWVIILTWFFLGTRYSLWQLFGAAISVIGLGLVLLSDVGAGGGGSRPLLGDMLVIAGTVFYSLSNVGEEYCVKNKDSVELMSMIGAYGLLVSIVQISIMEIKSLESVKLSADIIFVLAVYTFTSFTLYSIFSFVLKLSGAAMYNLSILTSDMWVVVIRIFFYHQKVNWLYFLAFAIVAIGVIIYATTEKDQAPFSDGEDSNNYNEDYQAFDNEKDVSRNEFWVS